MEVRLWKIFLPILSEPQYPIALALEWKVGGGTTYRMGHPCVQVLLTSGFRCHCCLLCGHHSSAMSVLLGVLPGSLSLPKKGFLSGRRGRASIVKIINDYASRNDKKIFQANVKKYLIRLFLIFYAYRILINIINTILKGAQ